MGAVFSPSLIAEWQLLPLCQSKRKKLSVKFLEAKGDLLKFFVHSQQE